MDVFYTLGRWQPFCHHHFAAIHYFADGYDADEVHIGVLRTPDGVRRPQNPFTDEEVKAMIDTAYEEAYDVDYTVDPFIFQDNPLRHRTEVAERIGDEVTFFTRQEGWLRTAKVLEAVERIVPGPEREFSYRYEPRDDTLLEPIAETYGIDIKDCATGVRDAIGRGEAWRDYVAEPVAAMIEDQEEAVAVMAGDKGVCARYDKFQIMDRARERVYGGAKAVYRQVSPRNGSRGYDTEG